MIAEESNHLGESSDEIEGKPDPRIFKADLYAAANGNKTEELIKYISEGVPPTHIDEKSGWTPLHWAATHGNVQMVKELLEHGASAPYHRMVKKERSKKMREARLLEEAKRALNSNSGPEKAAATNPDASDEGAGADESKGDGAAENEAKESGGGVPADVSANPSLADNGAAAAGKGGAGAPAAEESEDDEDVDFDMAMERKLETSVNLLKNTPLLWAAAKGHLRVLWLLLLDGYSPNDVDDMNNNALHLAALSSGNIKILRILIEDGAYSTKVNVYKNLPIDMATDKECRHVLQEAMQDGASMTEADITAKHEKTVQKYTRLCSNLENALSTTRNADGIANLTDTLRLSNEAGLPADKIALGERIVMKLELKLELEADLAMVQRAKPIRDQKQFLTTVHKLESTVARAKNIGADATQIQFAEDLISHCEIEYWITTLAARLENVVCAVDTDEHDMNRLRSALQKGKDLHANDQIVASADTLCKRLYSELGMSRALATLPTVKMPLKEGAEYPEDYWGPDDIGHVVETEGYPYPPADTNEYAWQPAKSYTNLQLAIANIKSSYVGAEDLGANADVCAEAKAKLSKAERDLKVLHVKNEADKALAIEATAKLCKKKPAKKK